MGDPRGRMRHRITPGVVASIGGWQSHDYGTPIRCIDHSAPIYPGNSGGPLLDDEARLVGMNTFSGAAGESSAIPVDTLRPVVEQLIRNAEARRFNASSGQRPYAYGRWR